MADCECLSGCPFFNDKMANMPAMAASYKKRYCHNEYATCGRYMVFKALGKAKVPADMFPNQEERARTIIAGG
ncbi:hypothetical protein CCR95_16530 [Thiocystis minor]|nr:hypothetical protein [Thiocystis minor]